MLTNRTSAVAVFLLGGAAAAGLALLPSTDGRWTGALAWGCAAALLFGVFAASLIARARPTRSITHLLHDLENPAGRP